MQVDAVTQSNGHAYGLQKTHPKDQEPPEEQPPASGVTDVSAAQEQKGVIRLLQEGHFKGVADVRLRINFHDELAGIQSAQMQAVTGDNIDNVLESVAGVVDSFLAQNELTEEQAAAVHEAHDLFIQTVAESDDPATAIEDAFSAFIELLQGLIPPPPEEETPPPDDPEPEPPADPEPPPEPQVDWQAFIETLQSTYLSAMENLDTALTAVSTLPPLSEPSGNGVAYDKFLTIYNQLWGIEPPAENLDQTEPPEPPPPEPEPPGPTP